MLDLSSGAAFYEYDFGDSWLHRIELMSRRPANDDTPPALLIDGGRRGPLEDSGGFPGYEEIMVALADPSHPGHAEHSAWVADMTGTDKPFDPAFLDARHNAFHPRSPNRLTGVHGYSWKGCSRLRLFPLGTRPMWMAAARLPPLLVGRGVAPRVYQLI